jgi:signal transduction histidine kinase
MASEGLVETRRAISALRADALPLEQELARATAASADRFGIAVTMHTDGTPRPVPPDATLALLRVAQEALVNAAKHAPGQQVTLGLEFGPSDIGLTVRNDLSPGFRAVAPPAGPGAEPDAGTAAGTSAEADTGARAGVSTADTGARAGVSTADTGARAGVSTADTGYGLTSMRERLRLLNGVLDAGPADGQWTVSAWLPLAPASEPASPLPA